MAKSSFYIKKNPINTPPFSDVPDVALSTLSSLLINGFIYFLKDEKKYLTMNRPGISSTAFCDLGTSLPIDGLWWWPSQKLILAVSGGKVFKIDQSGTATQLTGVTLTVGLTNFAECGVGGTVVFMASGGQLVYTDDLITLKTPQGLGVPTAATHVSYMDDRVIANEKGTATFRWTDPGVYTADIIQGTDGNNYMCINPHVAVSTNGLSMTFKNGNFDPTGIQILSADSSATATVLSVSLESGSFALGTAQGKLNLSAWNGTPFLTGPGTFIYKTINTSLGMTFTNGSIDPTGKYITDEDKVPFATVISVTISSGSFSGGDAAGTLNISNWNLLNFNQSDIYETSLITWNSADKSSSINIYGGLIVKEAWIEGTWTGGMGSVRATQSVPSSGKYWWEIICNAYSGTAGLVTIGIALSGASLDTEIGSDEYGWSYRSTGEKYSNGVASLYGESFGNSDIIGIAVDADNGTVTFYKNGVPQGVAFTGLPSNVIPAISLKYGVEVVTNFGATSFTYSPPFLDGSLYQGLTVFSACAVATSQPTSGGTALYEIAEADTNPVNVNSNEPVVGNAWATYWQATTVATNKTWTESDQYNPGWQGISFANMEAKGEVLQALDTRFDTIILFGKKSIEYWVNDGTSPFSKYEGLTSETGTVSPYSVIFNANMHWMIDNDKNLVQLINRAPKVISNPFASLMQKMNVIDDAFTISVKCDGRNFVVITFPTENITIAYDAENDTWQGQWGLWNTTTANFDMWIPRCSCKCPEWGFDLVGDRRTGKIYKISRDYSTDAESILKMVKRTGMLDYGIKYQKRSERIRITLQRGVGLASNVEPVFTMKSNIDGKGWENEIQGSLGKTGDLYSIVEFRQNGIFRYRQDEYSFSDAVPIILIDAEEEITVLSR